LIVKEKVAIFTERVGVESGFGGKERLVNSRTPRMCNTWNIDDPWVVRVFKEFEKLLG